MGQPRCGPRTVASPYGDATVTDDDHGVLPIEADTEAAPASRSATPRRPTGSSRWISSAG